MTPASTQDQQPTPSSPPPSFRSRASSITSRHLLSSEDPTTTEAERTLNDTFDDGSESDDEDRNGGDGRQRLMRVNTTAISMEPRSTHEDHRSDMQRIGAQIRGPNALATVDVSARPYAAGTPYSSFSHSNDGVFANLNAKPERGEKTEEQPPVRTRPADLNTHANRPSPTRQPRQTPHLHTGRPLSWLLVTSLHRTKYMSMVCLLALFSPLSGME